jgi:hypothetical protein
MNEEVRRQWWVSDDAWWLYWGDHRHHLQCLDRFWSEHPPELNTYRVHRFTKQWAAWRVSAGENLEARRAGLPACAADAVVFGMYDAIAGPIRGHKLR